MVPTSEPGSQNKRKGPNERNRQASNDGQTQPSRKQTQTPTQPAQTNPQLAESVAPPGGKKKKKKKNQGITTTTSLEKKEPLLSARRWRGPAAPLLPPRDSWFPNGNNLLFGDNKNEAPPLTSEPLPTA